MVRKRVTVMMDEDLDRRLRVLQAKQIKRTSENYTYSQMVNDAIRQALRYTS